MLKKIICTLLTPLLLLSAVTVSAEEKEDRIWKDEVIYSLMVDRFNNGDDNNDFDVNMTDPLKFQGGDFQGIINKLEYLHDMGFTTLQLSPIFANEKDGYHGQWVKDYQQIEEHFGTMETFNELLEKAHDIGMKVIIEFPVIENDLTDDEMINVATYWIQNTNIDGYHITNMKSKSIEFWKVFSQTIKEIDPKVYLSGADIQIDDNEMNQYFDVGFDSLLHTSLNQPLRDAFSSPNQSLTPLFDGWEQVSQVKGNTEIYLDNVNTERFTREMVNENEYPGARWKMALTYLYTQPEIPVIYYASEIAVDGGLSPENTPFMNFRTDEELIEYFKLLGPIRQNQKALTRGTMELLHEDNGMIIFKRQYEDETIVVAINNTNVDQKVIIPASELKDDMELRGLLGTDMVRSDQGEYAIYVDREAAEIYKLTNQSSINIFFVLSIFFVFGAFTLFMYIAWKKGKNREPDNN